MYNLKQLQGMKDGILEITPSAARHTQQQKDLVCKTTDDLSAELKSRVAVISPSETQAMLVALLACAYATADQAVKQMT